MPSERRYRAPREYGAWVGGQYFEPGRLLPAGTTRYRVVAIENYNGLPDSWRTVHAMFNVGTSFEDIEDEIGLLFDELWEEDYGLLT